MSKVLVTGCNGYIGSHTVKLLAEHGHEVFGMDRHITRNDVSKYLQEPETCENLTQFVGHKHFDAVIHLAAKISVEESVSYPAWYYETNITGTQKLLAHTSFDHFIFGSTGTAFNPTNPYARSKLCAEDLVRAQSRDYTIFRFFNVAGNGDFKQVCKPTHLIRMAAMVAAGKRDKLTLFGNDYNTKDGTCLRDYVHVNDVASSLVKAVDKPANTDYECLSSGTAYTNLEVAQTMNFITGGNMQIEFADRRPGDDESVLAPSSSAYFEAIHSLKSMCFSAYTAELAC